MTQTSPLYRLQSIDSEVAVKRSRLDEINVLLGENQEVRAARERLSAAEEQVRAARAHIADLELGIAGLDDKAKATEKRLYGGTVGNPKELQDMDQELASLRGRRETLEETLLEAMLALEEGQSQEAQARSELEVIEARWAASQGDLAKEKQTFEARLLDLEADRQRMLAKADANMLAVYEHLRARLGGLAVATIKDGVCTACGVAPTSMIAQKARRGQLDALCPTCGRILYTS